MRKSSPIRIALTPTQSLRTFPVRSRKRRSRVQIGLATLRCPAPLASPGQPIPGLPARRVAPRPADLSQRERELLRLSLPTLPDPKQENGMCSSEHGFGSVPAHPGP